VYRFARQDRSARATHSLAWKKHCGPQGQHLRTDRERLSVAPAGGAFNEIEASSTSPKRSASSPSSKRPARDEKISAASPAVPSSPRTCRGEIRHELNLAERQCDCGGVLAEIGVDVSEQLDYVPAKFRCCATCASSMPARVASSA